MDEKSVYKLYNKRDSFPIFFPIIRHIDSNILSNIFHSALAGEKPV